VQQRDRRAVLRTVLAHEQVVAVDLPAVAAAGPFLQVRLHAPELMGWGVWFTRPDIVVGVKTRIPVVIVAGYLGSGKTSLLNHLLRNNAGTRIGVVVNDFGAINIDSMLVAGQVEHRRDRRRSEWARGTAQPHPVGARQ